VPRNAVNRRTRCGLVVEKHSCPVLPSIVSDGLKKVLSSLYQDLSGIFFKIN
jgi:hypothetical protein